MIPELLSGLLIFDAIRLWRRALSVPTLPQSSAVVANAEPALLHEYELICAPGVTPPDDLRARATQWADDEGVLVVDLIPQGWSATDSLALLQLSHPTSYTQKPFRSGITAGCAVLVHETIMQANPPPEETDLLRWLHWAQELKRYAPWQTALVCATGWSHPRSTGETSSSQRAILRKLYGGGVDQVRWLSPIIWGIFAWLIYQNPVMGSIPLVLWLVQPAFIFAQSPLKVNWQIYSLLRPMFDFWSWLKLWGEEDADPHQKVHAKDLKKAYEALLANGTTDFFEARVTQCPLCQSDRLTPHLKVPDFYQSKPGIFTLERCMQCKHIFQNPRLSLSGLSFYYKDFYDGLGEDSMDMIFGASETSYRQRVSMIRAHGSPKNWLDVGGGHGHFALIAHHLLPQTNFDVLDLSDSVDNAEQRGWIRKGIKGLFPEQAETLTGQYDGISMSHYLEHTRDPHAEISAAAKVLDAGGLLMIEVPDPESKFGMLLKSWWLPWFQPQHQHFVSVENLAKIFEETGFELKSVDRSEAHQSVDLFFAALISIQRIAPDPSQPWIQNTGTWANIWRGLTVLFALPLIALGALLDQALRPLFARPGWSNTYRVMAIKKDDS